PRRRMGPSACRLPPLRPARPGRPANSAPPGRTHRLLRKHGTSIDVPEDVQDLVEQVHDDPTLALNAKREYERIADELAGRGEADKVTVDSPRDLETRGDLEGMTSVLFTDEQVATRLGADSVRVVCCFEDEQGRL